MTHGILTAQVADFLQAEFNPQGFDVLHDHRQKGVDTYQKLGKLRAYFGNKPKLETLLADLDIAVVSFKDNKIYALIEIEETTNKPKVIIGDITAVLLGNGIAFQGKQDLMVGDWTSLIVLSHDPKQSHTNRLAYIKEQLIIILDSLKTPNAKIGRIIIDTFRDRSDLENKLKHYILQSIQKNKSK